MFKPAIANNYLWCKGSIADPWQLLLLPEIWNGGRTIWQVRKCLCRGIGSTFQNDKMWPFPRTTVTIVSQNISLFCTCIEVLHFHIFYDLKIRIRKWLFCKSHKWLLCKFCKPEIMLNYLLYQHPIIFSTIVCVLTFFYSIISSFSSVSK